MSFLMEGRASNSPHVEMIWRGYADTDYTPTCPADSRWNLLLLTYNGRTRVTVEGPLTKALNKVHPAGTEWLTVKFKLGCFMPGFPVKKYLDGDVRLPNGANRSFWLNGSVWQYPDFENVETFVDRLVREGLLVVDPVVQAALQNQPTEVSFRTVRRRFIQATGLTQGSTRQIERAQRAMSLLTQGIPILDAVYDAGYADQSHMTRSLKALIGETPAQIVRANG